MNTEQHQPEKDSQIIQRPPSTGSLIIPANGSMGKLAGDSSHWTVPAARHGQARPTGTARLLSQPSSVGAWERDLTD